MWVRWFLTVGFVLSLISPFVRAQAPESLRNSPQSKPEQESEQAQTRDMIRDFVGSMQARIEIERRIQAVQEMHQITLTDKQAENPDGVGAEAASLNQFPIRPEIPQEILGLPFNYQTFSGSLADAGVSGMVRKDDPPSIL